MRRKVRNVKKDKRKFARTAAKSKAVNLGKMLMRGGIRF